ncbi:hypothetical protein GCM10010121_066400 [Streptomyces brasiliensis]|uniref:Uncharacterized protein n=1 Tax=Streptomyces brasiliensis TaxID=1954 RepID=A0A917L7F0_9ACTN|nr:hypothetical protein GCM10010121_066400 [Streptomyces brasiliensis]
MPPAGGADAFAHATAGSTTAAPSATTLVGVRVPPTTQGAPLPVGSYAAAGKASPAASLAQPHATVTPAPPWP